MASLFGDAAGGCSLQAMASELLLAMASELLLAMASERLAVTAAMASELIGGEAAMFSAS